MMHENEIARLRTQLRGVNIEYSALVRSESGEDRFVRMDELRDRRAALMALITKAAGEVRQRAPGTAAMAAAAQAA